VALVNEEESENQGNSSKVPSVEAEKQRMQDYEASMKSYRLKSIDALMETVADEPRGATTERGRKKEAQSSKTGKSYSGEHQEVDQRDFA
jgi:hypothetical protein